MLKCIYEEEHRHYHHHSGTFTHNRIVAETKTKKKRRFPIDVYIKRSLERIRRAQLEHNVASEWVFPHEQYGWTRSSIISSCLKNKCIQLGLDRTYGIHAFRKTLNSDMRMDNAPAKMCASMLGNTPEVNDQHYYYDTSKMDEKLTYVESAHKKEVLLKWVHWVHRKTQQVKDKKLE